MSSIDIVVPGVFTNPPGLIEEPDITSGLLLDYDADDLVASVANGAAITSITSKGSNTLALNTIVSSYTLPTLEYNSANGHAALVFNGSNSLKSATNPELLAQGQDATFVSVVRVTTGASARVFAHGNAATTANYRSLNVNTSSVQFFNSYTSTAVSTATQPFTAGVWFVAVCVNRGTTIELHTSTATTPLTNTVAASGKQEGLALGTNSGASLRLTGKIARQQVFTRAFSTSEIDAVLDVMSNRYGIVRA